jgi:hypothetical protein
VGFRLLRALPDIKKNYQGAVHLPAGGSSSSRSMSHSSARHRIAADVLFEYPGGSAEYEEDVTSLLSTAWRFSWTYRTS